MKERQRWKCEEDAVLRSYVKQYGPREWHLVPQRMNVPLERDAKSCLERWKNYLKPGIKKGSLSEDEQRLVIRLQAKHGNKWKKIAAEVPGRTAKRLGKWWEVFKEKQHREYQSKEEGIRKATATTSPSSSSLLDPAGKYDRILETFAEKLAKERSLLPSLYMASPLLPPWLSNNPPSVALTLSPTNVPPAAAAAAAQPTWGAGAGAGAAAASVDGRFVSELSDCCRELQEGHQAWVSHRKETAWRLKRVELQLESEKACKRKEKAEEIEAKMRALREEQKVAMERIEAEYREQIVGLRREADAKEQKLAEQWAAKHVKLAKFMEQLGCRQWNQAEANGR